MTPVAHHLPASIEDPACVAKTYPEYWDALASLGVRLTVTT